MQSSTFAAITSVLVEGFQVDCHTFVDAVTGHEGSWRVATDVVDARLGTTDAGA